MAEVRWVFAIKAQDKPGALTAAAGVFSNRGVSLETILGSGISLTGTSSRIVLSFRATERKKNMLLRAMERLAAVLQVECYTYESPELRAIAVVRVAAESGVDWDAAEVQTEVVSQGNGSQTLLLTGETLVVEQVIERLRDRDALLDVVVSVMAV